MNIIELNNISRSFKVAQQGGNFWEYMFHRKYKVVEAVKNVSFSIKKGELIGFIGPNGAGKSTTIKMMTGILVPTGGDLRVLGNIPHENRKENAKRIGVLFGQRSQLWWDLPVRDTFKLLKKIYKISDEMYERNLKTYGDLLGLYDFIDQPVRQLSLGQRMRADLCASLLHDPEILFLDEPTIGLDVVVKKQIREMIRQINVEKGVTIILTTHDMKDIEEICQRIIMIDKGQVIIDAPIGEVRHQFRGNSTISITLDKNPEELTIGSVESVEFTKNGPIVITFDAARISSAEIISKVMEEYKIVDVVIKEPEIDDIISNLYLTQQETR